MTTLMTTRETAPTRIPLAFNEAIYDEIIGRVQNHLSAPASRQQESAPDKFARLADEWRSATLLLSSTTQKISHPAYLAIIGMGAPVVPLILRELKRRPGHWSPALTAITGVVPYAPSQRGDLRAIARAWLEWGQVHGFDA